jgi:hypothetical protein
VSSVPGGSGLARPAPVPAPQSGASAGAAGFPRVDSGTQKARDGDRRRILDQELSTEQRSLDAARRELDEQESARNGADRNSARAAERLSPFATRFSSTSAISRPCGAKSRICAERGGPSPSPGG